MRGFPLLPPSPRFWLRRSALAVALALAAPAASAATSAIPPALHIPAQPLGSALISLGEQTRWSISFPPELVGGHSAPAVSGALTPLEALERLLAGSGLGYRLVGDSGAVIVAARQPTPASAQGEKQLPEVHVLSKRESLGTMTLDRDTIDAMPLGNGDITSLLKINPNVQFANNDQHTGRLGEIAPADVSINGAKFYSNLYLMDGMSFNNDINPAATVATPNNANNNASPPSASQGFAVDTSLVCRVTVRDSNVGAEYGRFSGGVVQADTCAPTKAFAGQVSVETTRDSWTRYKLSDAQEQAYASSADATYQPKFEKWSYRMALQGKPSDELGLIGSFVRRTSVIPLNGYSNNLSSGGDENRKQQERISDNYFLRGFWTPSKDVGADFSVLYAPGIGRYFVKDAKNSYFELENGGIGLNFGLHHPLGGATLTHRLVWSQMDSSRRTDSNVWRLWRYSAEKNWGKPNGNSGEGGWGDVDQSQENLTYQLKSDWKPFALLGLEHRLQAGLELDRQRSYYERKTPYEQYTASTNTTTCATAGGGVDTENCSMSTPYNAPAGQGQYLRSRLIYFAGKFEVNNTGRAFFLQDEMRLGTVRLRLGARYDSDDLAPKATWAPRSALFWDVLGDGTTRIEAGLNRYYGRNFMIYRTQAERLSLQTAVQTRSVSGGVLTAWPTPTQSNTWKMYHLGELKVPYADEQMAGISQKAGGMLWNLKYVTRKGRDEVILHLRQAGDYAYDNVGSSSADTWSLTAETLAPIKLAGTYTTVTLGLDRTRVKTSHADYSDTISNLQNELDKVILYNGKVTRWIDRPADNYNRPMTGRVLFNTVIPSARLTIGNFFRLRQSYEKIVATGKKADYNGTQIDVYEKQTVGKAITWDMRINWSMPTVREQEAYVTLSVDNVLNRSNAIELTGTDLVYEKGRQYWLEVGYRF